MVKVAINGFGRIGKSVLRAYFENGGKEKFGYDIVAINNPGDSTGAAHLFKYDSCFGTYTGDVELKDGKLIIDGHEIVVVDNRDPLQLPWKEMGIDIVIESTGAFTKREGAAKHIEAGA